MQYGIMCPLAAIIAGCICPLAAIIAAWSCPFGIIMTEPFRGTRGNMLDCDGVTQECEGAAVGASATAGATGRGAGEGAMAAESSWAGAVSAAGAAPASGAAASGGPSAGAEGTGAGAGVSLGASAGEGAPASGGDRAASSEVFEAAVFDGGRRALELAFVTVLSFFGNSASYISLSISANAAAPFSRRHLRIAALAFSPFGPRTRSVHTR
mmetsp:Transcript_1876/g.4738  ORF Transcript_1876/g.4738 Transcript_1876/m.4738 type:complete len:211 (-) Transcript_1876:719-1351(-)